MKFRWKKLIACGLALSICFNSTALTYAAKTDSSMVMADEIMVEQMVSEEFANVPEMLSDEAEAAKVSAKQKTQISAEKLDDDGRYYKLTLNHYTPETEPKNISFAVWNVSDGYTIWHQAEYDSETGTYSATVDMSRYEGSGTYTTHCYRENKDGSKQYVSGLSFEVKVSSNLKPVITKEAFTDDSKTEYVIEYSNVKLADGEVMRAAVWSEEKGQDDLKWTNFKVSSGNKATLTISVNDYASAGKFFVHIYRTTKDGANTFVASRNFEVPKVTSKKVEVTAVKNGDGTATIRIRNLTASAGIKSARVAIWSAGNQSDLCWYTATKSGDDWVAKMDLAKHKNNWSNYQVHAYATDGAGSEKFVGSTTVNYSFATRTPEVTIDKKNGVIKIQIEDLQFPEKVKFVRAAVWSDTDGQDDISWNVLTSDEDHNWSVEVPLSKLYSAGTCVFHIYAAKENDAQIYVGGGRFEIDAPAVGEAKVAADNKTGDFEITLEDVSDGATKVEAVVWCAADKSDQRTYTMKADKNGIYSVESNIKEHNCHQGTYQIQIYVADGSGIKTAVQHLSMSFKAKFDSVTVTPDSQETEYLITLKNGEFPYGVQKMEFAVWSEVNGQDDLKWYTAAKDGADYTAAVDIRNHKSVGKYVVHAYATNANGAKVYVTGLNFQVVSSTPSCDIAVTKATNTGSFDVGLKNVTAPSGVQSVRVAVWPTANSSIVKWYDAEKQTDGTYSFTVDVANHKHYCGAYTMHVYTVMGNGVQSFTRSYTYQYEPSNFLYVLKDQGNGKRTIGIYNPSDTENVRFAVWSETNGQDDCHWYTAAKAENGSWKASITYQAFEDSGTFSVHAYSGTKALKTMKFDFPKSEFGKNGWYYEEHYGRTYKLYYIDDVLQTDVRDIIGKQSSYKAEVNRTTCTVTMYAKDGNNGYIIPVCAFACSVGLPSTPTPTGTFNTLAKYRWHELMGPSWGQYCTRIVGGILFHSVAGSNMTSYNLSAAAYNLLGQPASHGCVRLCVRDAKWIYDNCSLGMTVRIYDSSYPGPLGKPATIKIPSWQNWDPTDPAVQ